MGITPTGFDPKYRFVTSWLFPPLYLGCLRILFSIYCFTTIFFSFHWFLYNSVTWRLKDYGVGSYTFAIGAPAIGESFSYFTYISYWSLAFYLAFAGMHAIVYSRTGSTWLHSWPKALQILHSLLHTTITCFPLMVTIVFWGSLFDGFTEATRFYQWHNISIHGFNSLFALFEILLTTTDPPPVLHLLFLYILLSLYLGVAYITYPTQHFWVYEWLDPHFGWREIVGHVFGFAGIIVGVFILVSAVIWTRCWALRRREEGIRARKDDYGGEGGSSGVSSGEDVKHVNVLMTSKGC